MWSLSTTPAPPAGPAGLVAGWSFDAGVGSVLADVSGNGNNGVITGATWVPGRFGSALSFNGVSDVVRVASAASLNVSSGMTLAAWIRPSAAQSGWRTVMQRQVDAWALNAGHDNGALVPAGGATINGNAQWITGVSASPVGSWTHVALTYDGATLRLFVNGVQVSSRAVSGPVQSVTNPLWIGGNQPYGEFFNGLIDEARVYNRALSVAELQTVMTTALGSSPGPDTVAPSVPVGLSASAVSVSQVNLSWSASTDDVGVTGYRVQRCAGAGCSSFVQVAAPSGTSVSDTGLAAGTSYSYRVAAVDAASNTSGFSTVVTVTTPAAPDTVPPSVPAGLSASAVSASQVNLSWSASTDNTAVTGYQVQRCAGAGCSSFVQVAAPSGTSVSDPGLTASTSYSYRVRAVDAAGNTSGFSTVVTVTTPAPPAGPAGLVAGWSFDAGAGSVLADVSGNGNNGVITGATWVPGRFGSALSFNGVSDVVRVASAASLNVSSGMTLAAWIRPSAAQSGWRTVMQRQVDAWALNAGHDNGALVPAGGATINGNAQWITGVSASPVGSWTHVALTYDGATLRLFVNGVQVSSRAVSGPVQSVTNPLWIGGNQPYGEFFNGLIDEARVYNRALSVAELQTVMNGPLL